MRSRQVMSRRRRLAILPRRITPARVPDAWVEECSAGDSLAYLLAAQSV